MITCTFENGNNASLRHTCANIIILNAARDSVLLARRASGMVGGRLWCVPGGYMERDQRIEETALREAREETGLEVKLLGLVCVVDTPERGDNGRQNIVFVLAGIAGEKVASADTESTEQRWFPLASLPSQGEWAFDHRAMVIKYMKDGTLPFIASSLFLQSPSVDDITNL